jgi:hypothetical protein
LSLRGQGDRTESDEQRLYATWPSFRFTDGAYHDGWRDLAVQEGAPVGCIAEFNLAQKAQSCAVLPPAGAGRAGSSRSVGSTLVAMITGAAGRKATLRGSDAWSRTVDELLTRTARATVGGLGPQRTVRSAATYKGDSGSGFVVLENRAGLPLEAALTKAGARGSAPAEGPISVVHVTVSRSGPLDQVVGRA